MPTTLPPGAYTILLLVASNVFMTFAIVVMGEQVKMNYLYAGLCLLGAVYFIFRA